MCCMTSAMPGFLRLPVGLSDCQTTCFPKCILILLVEFSALTLLDGQLHGHPCAVYHGVVVSTDVCLCVCLLTAWSKNVQIAHRRGSISIVQLPRECLSSSHVGVSPCLCITMLVIFLKFQYLTRFVE